MIEAWSCCVRSYAFIARANEQYEFGAYGDDGVAGGDGEDVGAGHDLGAGVFELRLDVVDYLEAAKGVLVGHRVLLPGGAVEQH
jgi:hypothetical protein